jgi:hypothetical protein
VRQIFEPGELFDEREFCRAGRPVALFANDDLG